MRETHTENKVTPDHLTPTNPMDYSSEQNKWWDQTLKMKLDEISNEEQQGRTLRQLLHWSGSQRGRGDEADQKLERGGEWLKTKGEQR